MTDLHTVIGSMRAAVQTGQDARTPGRVRFAHVRIARSIATAPGPGES